MRLSARDDLTNKTPTCHICKLLFHMIAFSLEWYRLTCHCTYAGSLVVFGDKFSAKTARSATLCNEFIRRKCIVLSLRNEKILPAVQCMVKWIFIFKTRNFIRTSQRFETRKWNKYDKNETINYQSINQSDSFPRGFSQCRYLGMLSNIKVYSINLLIKDRINTLE